MSKPRRPCSLKYWGGAIWSGGKRDVSRVKRKYRKSSTKAETEDFGIWEILYEVPSDRE